MDISNVLIAGTTVNDHGFLDGTHLVLFLSAQTESSCFNDYSFQ